MRKTGVAAGSRALVRALALLALLALAAGPLRAEGERAGDFDYWLLALSWAPAWCAAEGAGRDSAHCDPEAGAGFVLHGLWPQDETGWPSFCRTPHRDPTRAETAAMTDLMGSPGAAWHQWRKHGRCSGLPPDAYFALVRRVMAAVRIPPGFTPPARAPRATAAEVEAAFLAANPGWRAEMLTVTCREGRVREARLCLDRALRPRRCGPDVIRDCRDGRARLDSGR